MKKYIHVKADVEELKDDIVFREITEKDINSFSSPQIHETIEIIYCISGNFQLQIRNENYNVKEGDLVVVNNLELHKFTLLSDTVNFFRISVSTEQFYYSVKSLMDYRAFLPFIFDGFTTERKISAEALKKTDIPALIKNIIKEYKGKKYGHTILLKNFVLLLLVKIIRYWRDSNVELINGEAIPEDIIKIIVYISTNIDTVNAKDVAIISNYSYTYFSELFKKYFNKNFREYLVEAKISRAQQLLMMTEKTVAEISEMVGYSTTSHFIKQFKNVTGDTPSHFRQTLTQVGKQSK